MFCGSRFRLVAAACFLQVAMAFAQSAKYTSFTAKDGLPSSYVYSSLEDDKGFLWVSTIAGVARFDGKYFQVFTTKDGLPDNEVFSIVKEKDGRIWAECFSQIPSYFDEVQNRFVVPYLDKETAGKMVNTLAVSLRPLPDGGIVYGNRDRWVAFKEGKRKTYGALVESLKHSSILRENADGSILVIKGAYNPNFWERYHLKLYHIKGEKILDSIVLTQHISEYQSVVLNKTISSYGFALTDGNIWFGFRNLKKMYVYSDFQINPLRGKTDSLLLPEFYINYFRTPNRLAFLAESGKICLYDSQTLQPLHTIQDDYLANSYFNDSKGNEWIGTIDKGLVVYRNKPLRSLTMPEHFSNANFMSVTRKNDGTLLAGNYYGEVVEIQPEKTVVHQVIDKSPARIRKILIVGGHIYTFSEEGIYHNFKTRITDPTSPSAGFSFGKTAIVYNDTTILVATNRNLLRLNTKTNKLYGVNSSLLRITALAKAGEDWIYFGSVNGLYKYNYKTNSEYIPLSKTEPLLGKRVSGLCYTPDSLLWITQSDNVIAVMKEDRIIASFRLNKEVINSTNKHITAGKQGQIWVSTSNGISIIDYVWKNGIFSYTTQNLSEKDGLPSNEVEEIFYQDGNMHVATSKGISVVPDNYVVSKTDIPTYLIRMMINAKEAVISDHYQLEYGQQNLQMQFSGVDLNGNFGFFQYRLDHTEWTKLDGNTLNIQLRTGNHQLKVRSVDMNGNVGSQELVLSFDVAVPIWLNIRFWILLGVLVQIVLFYLINRYQKRRRETKLAQKIARVQAAAIEQQAFTSLMNPHFMFNALNSIQHYINVQDRKNANRYLSDFASLIRKNFDAAQQSFIPLEEEIENIKIYLELEKMRFSDRFQYSIHEDEAFDTSDWMIPTMILQPLLENALLHGIMPSAQQGKIWLCFGEQGQDLFISITDNGIGIANSQALKRHNDTHQSRGMELIRKRIVALSSFGSKPISLSVTPAFDSVTNPGNTVTILIPPTLYQAWQVNRR